MSLVIRGGALRRIQGVQSRKVGGEIFAAWQVQVARDRWLGTPTSTPTHTVQEFIAEYLATVTPRKAPHLNGGIMWSGSFEAALGHVGLEEHLRTKTLEDYLAARLQRVTLATVSKELGVLESAYGRAMRWEWISTTPFRGLALNEEGEARVRWLTDDEAARLVGMAAPWLRDLILVGLDTGLRRSNLGGLQWSWLHDHVKTLIVPRQHVKAKKATVMIPLTTRAATIIARQPRQAPCVLTHAAGRAYSLEQVSMAVMARRSRRSC